MMKKNLHKVAPFFAFTGARVDVQIKGATVCRFVFFIVFVSSTCFIFKDVHGYFILSDKRVTAIPQHVHATAAYLAQNGDEEIAINIFLYPVCSR